MTFSKNFFFSHTKRFSALLYALVFFMSQSLWAGVGTSIMQTAPVLDPGEFEIKLQNDIILNAGGGINISPHLRTGIVEHFVDLDVHFGTGKTGFQIGGLAKYNLLPDLPDQMGLSFLAGASYLKDNDLSFGLLSFGILTSKELQSDFGLLTPYLAVQPEVLFRSDLGEFVLSLALGAHWKVEDTSPWSFFTEFGVSLKNSNYNLAVGVAHPF